MKYMIVLVSLLLSACYTEKPAPSWSELELAAFICEAELTEPLPVTLDKQKKFAECMDRKGFPIE